MALSLRRRGRKESQFRHVYHSLPWAHWIRPKRGGFVHSLRCDQLDSGLALWREYIEQAERHVAFLKERAFEVSFEELVREPVRTLADLSGFCNLRVGEAAIHRASIQINPAALPPRNNFQLYGPALHSS